jgi:uncharacterized protein (TIGR03437 family)
MQSLTTTSPRARRFGLLILSLLLIAAGYATRRTLLVPAHAQGQATTANTLPVADFNGDGKLDVAFIHDYRDVAIALGNGDGTFQNGEKYTLGIEPYNLQKGDFNADGKPDLAAVYQAIGSNDFYVGVLIGKGNGTFNAPVRYKLAPFTGWRGLAVGDFTGDGKLDLLAAGGNLTMLVGGGDGNFQVRQPQVVEGFTFVISAAAGDFNGDGKLDLAMVPEDNRLKLMFGNGDGTFGGLTTYDIISRPVAVVVGDYDADGKPDVVVAHESSISFFFNLSNGMLGSRRDYSVGSPLTLSSADFNGDAKPELLLSTRNNQKDSAVLLSPQCGRRISTPLKFDTLNALSNLPGDFDGDGKMDVVALAVDFDGNPQLKFTANPDAGPPASACPPGYGDPAVSFAAPIATAVGPRNYSVAAGDFNLDGRLDLAATNIDAPQGVSILLGDGAGRFSDWRQRHIPISRADHAVVADLNADAKPDLLVVRDRFDQPGVPSLFTPYFGNGDGTFRAGGDFTMPSSSRIVLETADYNGDGKVDIAAYITGAILLYPGRGDGTFGASVRTPLGAFGPRSAATADYDGDGRLDLALLASDHRGRYAVMFGRGDGSFAARESDNQGFPIQEPTEADGAGAVASGDLNGDGRPDLVIALNGSVLAYQVMLNTGGANFTKRLHKPEFGINVGVPMFGDYNGDGKLDLAYGATQALAALPGLGDGNFSWNYYADAGVGTSDAVARDFNNDGKLDVAMARTGRCGEGCPDSTVAVFLNTTSATSPQPVPTPTPRPSPTPTPTPTTHFIRGQILDQNGLGVSGIDVTLSGSQSATRRTVPGGVFSFPASPRGGNYTVTPRGGGYNFTPLSQSVTNLRADTVFNFTALPAHQMVTVHSATYRTDEHAFESIATLFGTGLSTVTSAAASLPLPTEMGGNSVRVIDSQGVDRAAPLFFVSPTQVNYQIPVGTAAGMAYVYATSADGTTSAANVLITQVAPGLFTADSSGSGFAAANVQRVKAGGEQSFEPVMQFDPARNMVVPVAVDLGAEGEQVYLVLYGTGLRFRTALSNVKATVGGQATTITYAGPQPQFVGVDQVNVLIPRSAKGAGEVNVALTVDGKAVNVVKMKIK